MSWKTTLVVVVLLVGGLLSVNLLGRAAGQAAGSTGVAPAGSPADACCESCSYIWSAKYLCAKKLDSEPVRFTPRSVIDTKASRSRSLTTQVNIHNPLDKKVEFTWRVAPARGIFGQLAAPSAPAQFSLGGHQAVQIDCDAIFRQFGQFDPEGFVVIESKAPLTVTAVYHTREELGSAAQVGGDGGSGVGIGIGLTISLDVEQVTPTAICER